MYLDRAVAVVVVWCAAEAADPKEALRVARPSPTVWGLRPTCSQAS